MQIWRRNIYIIKLDINIDLKTKRQMKRKILREIDGPRAKYIFI